MQITLNQDEIHQAVEAFVRNQITIAPNQQIEIDFTAGRAPNGLSATLSITTAALAQPTAAVGPISRALREGAVAASKDAVATAATDAADAVAGTKAAAEEPALEAASAEVPEEAEEAVEEKAPAEAAEEAPATKGSPFKRMAAAKELEQAPEEGETPAEAAPKASGKSIFSKAS